MAKKSSGNIDKKEECPVCGGIIWGRGQKVIIEGAKMTVCANCAQFGAKIAKKPPKTKPISGSSYSFEKNRKTPISTPKPKINETEIDEELDIVPDYAEKIRKIRATKNLNQDKFAQKLNEKPSLLRRIESGKVKPTMQLAKKIEKVYGISLIQSSDQVVVDTKKYMKKARGTSLGDIAFIKKKK